MSLRAAFQGCPGAYSDQSCQEYYGNELSNTVPCRSFMDCIDAIFEKGADRALIPVANSTAGPVREWFKILREVAARGESDGKQIWIDGENPFRVQHYLLAPKGTKLEEIHTAISHPQALAQSEVWLAEHNIKLESFPDTAGAAEELQKWVKGETSTDRKGYAAVCSKICAPMYDMDILGEDLCHRSVNITLMLSYQVVDRTSIPDRIDRDSTSDENTVWCVLMQPAFTSTVFSEPEKFWPRMFEPLYGGVGLPQPHFGPTEYYAEIVATPGAGAKALAEALKKHKNVVSVLGIIKRVSWQTPSGYWAA
eukprot:Clim_evm16s155 gene=Clim_evmTU16s155